MATYNRRCDGTHGGMNAKNRPTRLVVMHFFGKAITWKRFS
jgi:hypothetical protein